MPLYDYRCEKCESFRQVYYSLKSFKRTRRLKCWVCGVLGLHSVVPGGVGYRFDNPNLYGRFWSSFGCVVKDASHLRELQRRYGCHSAADRDGGADPSELELHDAFKRAAQGRRKGGFFEDPKVLQSLSPEESMRLAHSGE